MAKTSYLNLTNKILRRITQDVITDVSTATGTALIVTNMINEAQIEVYNEHSHWYSLYATRVFTTSGGTAEYALQSDYGATIDLFDKTNNRMLIEEVIRPLDAADPDEDTTGVPTHFAIQGSNYRLFPIPGGAYNIKERYWTLPTTLTANANTSDLPIEVENALFYYALAEVQEYLNKFEQSDRSRLKYRTALTKAIAKNKKKIDRLRRFKDAFPHSNYGIAPPRFPSSYGRQRY